MGYWGDHSWAGDGPMDLTHSLADDPGTVLLSWITGKAAPSIRPYGPHEVLGAAMYVSMIGGIEGVEGPPVILPIEVYDTCGRIALALLKNQSWLNDWKEPDNKRAALQQEMDHVLDQLEQLKPEIPRREWLVRWRLNPYPDAARW